jgi:multiple sugar transport system permease protein
MPNNVKEAACVLRPPSVVETSVRQQTVAPAARSARMRGWAGRTIVYVVLLGAAVFFDLPFVWMLVNAFKPESRILTLPPTWIPLPFTTANFVQAFSLMPLARYYVNSLIISTLSTAGAVASAALVGYAFARLDAPGKGLLFVISLMTLMIPGQVTLFPQYAIYYDLGWINTYLPLIVPSFLCVGGVQLFAFLMRQFFMSIPKEFEHAAIVDGCTPWLLFWRIMLPLAAPGLATVAIFQWLFSWNDFFGPLIYLTNGRLFTLPLGLATFASAYGVELGPLLAGSVAAAAPVVAVFLLGQRAFVRGLLAGGIKG